MKTNERILVNSLLSLAAIPHEGVILDAFEGMEESDVANTHRKRVSLGAGVHQTLKAHVENRLTLDALIDKIFASDAPIENKKRAFHGFITSMMDSSVCHGYVVGKYAPNNETLDSLVEGISKGFEEEKKRNPEKYAKLEKYKKEKIAEGVAAAEKLSGEAPENSLFTKFKKSMGL